MGKGDKKIKESFREIKHLTNKSFEKENRILPKRQYKTCG